MDSNTYSTDEDIPTPSPEGPIFTSSGGGMFSGSQYFSIGGGIFNNTTNHYHPAPVGPPDFRRISMGDIDLQRELMVNKKSGVIDRQLEHERRCVRRVYSAKIKGRNTDLTVAMYEGDGAEEAWQQHIKMYMSLRHPNIVQMYGTASSGAMYATIFHGDLIPIRQFMASASPIMTVYIDACYVTEWQQARAYVEKSPYFCTIGLPIPCTLSIRRSNRWLCVDFVPQPESENAGSVFFSSIYTRQSYPPLNTCLDPPSQELAAIDSLTLEEYHFICSFTLHRFRFGSFSSSATISSGAVFLCPPNGQPQEGAEIASLSLGAESFSWDWHLGEERVTGVLMENNWTRFNTKDVSNVTLTYTVQFYKLLPWLTQANYIFSHLQITSNLEDYFLVDWVEFRITIGNTREDAPPGYFFLCPTTDFQNGLSSFRWPDCPVYWSLDSSGLDRLTTEEATDIGLPSFQLITQVRGWSWDASVYAGLRQFHRAKGFDPDSQDIARHLGQPLYELSLEVDSPFAYVGKLSENNEDDGGTDEENMTEDSDGQVEACVQNVPCDVPSHLEANSEPQIPSDHGASGNFIHRFFWGLYQGLETEIKNVDTGVISPFLV